eukprot:1680004-Rhodomonas_salina.1
MEAATELERLLLVNLGGLMLLLRYLASHPPYICDAQFRIETRMHAMSGPDSTYAMLLRRKIRTLEESTKFVSPCSALLENNSAVGFKLTVRTCK